jgi:hypothetical protein
MDQPLILESNTNATMLVFEPRRFLSRVLIFVRSHAAELTSGALLAVMTLQMFAVIWRKSITIDEIVMIPSAYYHLVDGDFQLVKEHPPLSKIFAAVPLLFVQPNEHKVNETDSQMSPDEVVWAKQATFWDSNAKRFATISFWARVPMIILTLGLGVLIFIFARSLFGPRAAVFAVALFSLEPTILAHGRVVQTDVPAAFGYLLFFMALYWYASETTWRRAAFLGAAAAIAILAKYSMLLVGLVLPPVFIILWWLSPRRRAVAVHAALALLSMLLLINAAYFFQHAPLSEVDHTWITANFTAYPWLDQVTGLLSYLVPKEFVLGILFQFLHNREGHLASLLGMYSETGWWYYFPVAFGLKTTLPFLLLSLTSSGWAFVQLLKNRNLRFLWLLLPTVIYSIFVLFSHINIGVRYLLPIFPFLIIMGAALLDHLFERRRSFATVLAILLFSSIGVEAVRAYPNHMSYMNQIASGAPHWWYLSDSNVEWGDDVRGLALYLQERGERRVLDATLGGFGILRFYGIDRADPMSKSENGPDGPRYLAIGASYLNGSTLPSGPRGSSLETLEQRVNLFADFRQRTPEAIIGGSIYVFRVR